MFSGVQTGANYCNAPFIMWHIPSIIICYVYCAVAGFRRSGAERGGILWWMNETSASFPLGGSSTPALFAKLMNVINKPFPRQMLHLSVAAYCMPPTLGNN